jgi:NADH:ubiquinone oxidoreductase subunit F (NADH-binding)
VARPGVYELPMGIRLADVLGLAGPQEHRSSTPGARRFGSWSPQVVEARHRHLTGALAGVGAILTGGYFGSWLAAGDAGHARLCNGSLRPLGAGLGCGAIVVLAEDACGLDETARILAWLAGQTAGQCGPCVYGLGAIAGTVAQLRDGRAGGDALAHLRRWAGQVEGRGGCRMPDGAVRLLRSALQVFAGDVQRHLAGRPCTPADVPLVPVPARTDGGSPWG